MVTKRIGSSFSQIDALPRGRARPSDFSAGISQPGKEQALPPAPAAELLILIEGKKVQHVAFPVDQQHSPAIDNALEIAGQFGQLVLTSQGQSLRLVLYLRRQTSTTVNLPLCARGQFRTLRGCRRKV